MRKNWLKFLSVALLLYAFIGGLLLPVPARPIVNESIRNLYYHVPMWFGMMVIMTVSVVNAVRYLRTSNLVFDIYSAKYGITGILLGVLVTVTGVIWDN